MVPKRNEEKLGFSQKEMQTQHLRNCVCFRHQLREGRHLLFWVPEKSLDLCLTLALAKGPNRVGVSLPSPEDGNRYSFRNAVFFLVDDGHGAETHGF
jgi:hypothetical protein